MAGAKKNQRFWYSFENNFERCNMLFDYPTRKEALKAAREEKPDADKVWIGICEEISPEDIIGGVIDGEKIISDFVEKLSYEYDAEAGFEPTSNEIIELEERLIDTVGKWFDDNSFSTGVYKFTKAEEVIF